MRKFLTTLTAVIGLVVAPLVVVAAPAHAVQAPQAAVVSEVPAGFTPHVLDGRVYSVVQVGDMIVLGGAFSQVRSATDPTVLTRRNVVAFNATTGVISSSFNPSPDGDVTVVLPAGDGTSVYVGGNFNNIAGAATPSLARLSVADGRPVAGFTPPAMSGRVRDLRLVGDRLWVGGTFTHIGGSRQPALATINATTGAFDPYMRVEVAGIHNDGNTTVIKMDVNPAGTRLVAIGNFRTVGGATHNQVVMVDLSGPSAEVADWHTNFYAPPCSTRFFSYMRDLDISPDGQYFVISTTGAYGGSTGPCDTTARFEVESTGTNIVPTWVNYTGGDTTYAVAITSAAVYVGGHQRWQNNPFAGDRAGAGAVDRQGIAALDPANGLPLSWNPTRTRGVGVFDMLATDTGLWVASDTDRIGAWHYRARIAFLPLAGGKVIPPNETPTLPGSVYLAGPRTSSADTAVLHRVNAGGPALESGDGGPAWAADNTTTSSVRTSGSNVSTYTGGVTVAPTVGAGTPAAVFNSERWDPSAAPAMQWAFPVPAGTPVEVRLYFADRYSGTSTVGSRVFNVDVEGSRVLAGYDIVADAGHQVGTVKRFPVVSDGTVNINFSHVVENPLVNAIEIVRTDVGPSGSSPDGVHQRAFSGSVVGATADAPAGGISWSSARGAFMLNGNVYTAWANGTFTRRTFDGVVWGDEVPVNTHDLLVPLAAWAQDVSAMTGMFFDNGRLYFTRTGSSDLFDRYFTPESDVIGAHRLVASGSVAGLSFANARGMFLAGDTLYVATSDGSLVRADWSGSGPVADTAAVVSGPDVDGSTWSARAMFIYQSADGSGPAMAPQAQLDVSCVDQLCSFSAEGSSQPGGSIASYEWDLGDGTAVSGPVVQHRYAESGAYTVTLTVTDDAGRTATATRDLSIAYVSGPPTAVLEVSCLARVCVMDGTGSTDPDGLIAAYDWDFGDGQTAAGEVVEHTYAADGEYTITLRVTDGSGATDEATSTVTVEEPATNIEFVGTSGVNRNSTVFEVGVPTGVQAGDTLLAFFTGNSTVPTLTGPAGWSELESADGNGIAGRVWTRKATAADVGGSVRVSASAFLKGDLRVLAYRGAAGVSTSELALESTTTTEHTTPAVVGSDGAFLISYWSHKSSLTTQWTPPGSVVERASGAGSGGGNISSLVGDSGPLVKAPIPGATATASDPSNRAVMVSIVLATTNGGSGDPTGPSDPTGPGDPVDPTGENAVPEAVLSVSCSDLDCVFDGSGSSDPDGTIVGYAWDFGDGASGTGAQVTHSYAAAGEVTVTLTVTDDAGATGQASRTVAVEAAEPGDPIPPGDIELVGTSGVNRNSTRFEVEVPAGVKAGDVLTALFTGNSTAPSLTGPDGWTALESVQGNGIVAHVWTRVAQAGDAGSRVAVVGSGLLKGDLTLVAHRGAAGVHSSDVALETVARSDHTTPAVDVPEGGVLVSYWAHKSSADTTWTLPEGVVGRAERTGTGGGNISVVAAESGPFGAGRAGGLVATASDPSSRAVMVSLVLR